MLRRIKRSKLEIYYDILYTLENETTKGVPRLTSIQQKSNMSYDKFTKNLDELEKRGLVTQNSPLQITEKGNQFLQDYGKINEFLKKMKIDYLSEEDI